MKSGGKIKCDGKVQGMTPKGRTDVTKGVSPTSGGGSIKQSKTPGTPSSLKMGARMNTPQDDTKEMKATLLSPDKPEFRTVK